MDLIKSLERRYSTKAFDPNKKISDEDQKTIENLLQLSPSSTNVQPWHFTIATSDQGKERIAKAAEGFYIFNKQKVLDASAVVVFSAKTEITDDHLYKVLDKEAEDGRYADPQFRKDYHNARKIFVDMHKYDYKDLQHWAEKQVYLNLGNFLLGLAQMKIDALPMEGLDMKLLDQELGLREKGFSSSIVVALGYADESDFNKDLPKSRLSKADIISNI
ncbi:oxygen-insensitive NAD(P)H nitroreductase [Acidaminobacter sp. JC074]|uniref:oxygen-insensitive NAD(P)H nitroreductase n=1 Tax=Acidaminobacter sp. JC074 TaxID=2530199 RepID=UPI001F0F9EEE|nr:oxygen-insensitive NAD(P)H nitroreductase [Acidaminobacter sp. JC074]MCH4885977.1 oxygen-insensitive NAD(P)H nitroreductase [Acidaminobacter sp. JC074]